MDETLEAELLRQGAFSPEEAVSACLAISPLLEHFPTARLSPSTVRLATSGPLLLEPEGGQDAPARALAALCFELLKGAPPPLRPEPGAFVGLPAPLRLALQEALGPSSMALSELVQRLRAWLDAQGVTLEESASAGQTPGVGAVLGSYRLEERLGSGGMGEVFRAVHLQLGRQVAIKVLHPRMRRQPEVVQRFFDEARIVNELNHPNIVQIHDFVQSPGAVYCVMELLRGHTLLALDAAQGPLPLRRVTALFTQVLAALEAAHARGVVHRDIKPENLFVTPSDVVKVLDFGIARRVEEGAAPRTQQGVVLGTPTYMAPEQAAGRAVDFRADLYSTGVALAEVLTRRPRAALDERSLPSVAASGEPLPPALRELLRQCLSLDPAGRPTSAAQVRQALESLAAPGSAPPSRWRAVSVVAGLATLAALAGWSLLPPPPAAGVLPVASAEPPPAGQPAPPPEPPPTPAAVAGPAPSPSPPAELRRSGPPPRARPRPPEVETPPGPPVPTPAVDPSAALRARMDALGARYRRLVERHGEGQLTTLERLAFQQAGSDVGTAAPEAPRSLAEAEEALRAAEARLER